MSTYSIIRQANVSQVALTAALANLRELLPELKDRSDIVLAKSIDVAFQYGVNADTTRYFHLEGNYPHNGGTYGGETLEISKGKTVIEAGIDYLMEMRAEGSWLSQAAMHNKLTGDIIPLQSMNMHSIVVESRGLIDMLARNGDGIAATISERILDKLTAYGSGPQKFTILDGFCDETEKRDESEVANFLDTDESSFFYADWLRKTATQQQLAYCPNDDQSATWPVQAMFHLAYYLENWATELEKQLR